MPRKMNEAGIKLLKNFEGLHDGNKKTPILEPEMCPRGIWTIGWGHALVSNGKMLKGEADKAAAMKLYWQRYPTGMLPNDADVLLILDLAAREHAVEKMVSADLTDNEFSALVDFVYNLGEANLLTSTLLRKLNANDKPGAAKEFSKWVYSGKQVLPGLVRRRQAEMDLFLKR